MARFQIKKGSGWKACFDKETGLYTAETGGMGNYNLWEITEDIYRRLGTEVQDDYACVCLIYEGRHLYMDVNDRCGPPYTVILDHDYEKLCPWTKIIASGRVWSDELTDAAVEIFASEKQNREQRRQRRAQREKGEPKQ